VIAGIPQHIIPMPEGNHRRNSVHSAMPSRRCATISSFNMRGERDLAEDDVG